MMRPDLVISSPDSWRILVTNFTQSDHTLKRVRGESEASQETSTTGGEDTDNNRDESGDSSFVKPVVVLGREIEARAENKGRKL